MSISPNVPSPEESYHYESSGTPRWISVLFGLLFVALAAVGVFAYTSTSKLTKDLGDAQKTNTTLSTQLEQANTRIAELKSIVEVTQQKVGMTAADVASAKSRAEAIRKEQIAADQKLATQLTAVQTESNEKIGAVATEVGGAKKDIADTRTDLEATKAKLESTKGDMGVMSGLIARNHDDLEELRRRGERNYYEFNLKKAKNAQRVGPIQINVSKTDPKKSKYTIMVFADDKQIEKRDKTSGEPVQFYVGQSRALPYEIVVFNVAKDQITGYLSTPKDGGSAPAPAPAAAAPAKP
jgi:predicted  nucleic acid-binding Zn-ribbon protein